MNQNLNMSLHIQFDLFEKNDDYSVLRKEFSETIKCLHNMRKALFAKNNDLMKMILKQQEEIDKLRGLLNKSPK